MNDFILGPQVPIGDNYFDQTFVAKARQHGEACPATPPTDANALNSFELLHYYDLPLVLYIAHRRTEDSSFLALARKAAGSWWQHPTWINSGRIRLFPDNATPAPRHAGIGGLIEYALDGHPELWDWINAYVRAAFDTWIKTRITQPQLHYGLREGAFALQYAAWLVKVLPDTFPLQSGGTATNGAALRAQYLADIESACVNYFGRLQLPDGSWRWNTTPDEPRDVDGGTWVGIMQAFMVGLTTSALIDAYEVVQTATVKENIKNQVLKACRHLYSDGPYVKDEVEVRSGKRIRGFHYFYHGGTSVNPTKYEKGDMQFPWTDLEGWWLASARQSISTVLPAYGWAYKVSGDEFFKTAGEELWDSAYSGRDGFRAMMDDTAKNFNQHARRGCSYRAWLGGGAIELPPLPDPIPTPVPTPTPTPDPVPEPPPPDGSVPVIDLISPTSGTSLSGRVTVTISVTNGTGITEMYLIVDGRVVSSATTETIFDTSKVADGQHLMFIRAWKGNVPIDSKPVSVMVKNAVEPPVEPPPVEPPEPDPVPTPTPCSISAPASVAVPRNGAGVITVTLQNLSGPTEVKVLGSDGQVSITPLAWTANATSSQKQFQVKVKNKRQVRVVTFQSGCGQAVVKVNVV